MLVARLLRGDEPAFFSLGTDSQSLEHVIDLFSKSNSGVDVVGLRHCPSLFRVWKSNPMRLQFSRRDGGAWLSG